MTWTHGNEPEYVFLVFEGFPNHHFDLIDADLSAYLDSLGTDRVRVRFDVTTRLGCIERIRLNRIGRRTDWIREWGGSGWVNRPDPSPWDRFDCKIPWLRP